MLADDIPERLSVENSFDEKQVKSVIKRSLMSLTSPVASSQQNLLKAGDTVEVKNAIKDWSNAIIVEVNHVQEYFLISYEATATQEKIPFRTAVKRIREPMFKSSTEIRHLILQNMDIGDQFYIRSHKSMSVTKYLATVMEKRSNALFVHYEGWSDKYDEWIDYADSRIVLPKHLDLDTLSHHPNQSPIPSLDPRPAVFSRPILSPSSSPKIRRSLSKSSIASISPHPRSPSPRVSVSSLSSTGITRETLLTPFVHPLHDIGDIHVATLRILCSLCGSAGDDPSEKLTITCLTCGAAFHSFCHTLAHDLIIQPPIVTKEALDVPITPMKGASSASLSAALITPPGTDLRANATIETFLRTCALCRVCQLCHQHAQNAVLCDHCHSAWHFHCASSLRPHDDHTYCTDCYKKHRKVARRQMSPSRKATLMHGTLVDQPAQETEEEKSLSTAPLIASHRYPLYQRFVPCDPIQLGRSILQSPMKRTKIARTSLNDHRHNITHRQSDTGCALCGDSSDSGSTGRMLYRARGDCVHVGCLAKHQQLTSHSMGDQIVLLHHSKDNNRRDSNSNNKSKMDMDIRKRCIKETVPDSQQQSCWVPCRIGNVVMSCVGDITAASIQCHTRDIIYPVNFVAYRRHWRVRCADEMEWYRMEIRRHPDDAERLRFFITAEQSGVVFAGASTDEVWGRVLHEIRKHQQMPSVSHSINGDLLFGLPWVKRNIEALPNALFCQQYQFMDGRIRAAAALAARRERLWLYAWQLFLLQPTLQQSYYHQQPEGCWMDASESKNDVDCARMLPWHRQEQRVMRRHWVLWRAKSGKETEALEIKYRGLLKSAMLPCGWTHAVMPQKELPLAMRYRVLQLSYRRKTRVQKSMIQGWGLFAMESFEPNEMVIEYMGEIINPVRSDVREKDYEQKGIGCYMFRLDDRQILDATCLGNTARFINHSCEPNCYSTMIELEGVKKIVICAGHPITPGTELTYDYMMAVEEDVKLPCYCASAKCRVYMN